MPKKTASKPGKPGLVTPRQFRLADDTLSELDLIAADRTAQTGARHTRTDAIRVLARQEAERIRRRTGGGK